MTEPRIDIGTRRLPSTNSTSPLESEPAFEPRLWTAPLPDGRAGRFVAQLIEVRTARWDEFTALSDEWQARTEGTRPHRIAFYCADRDRPDTYLVYVQWDSYEDAQRNNALPETHDISARMAELCDEPPIFRNLDVAVERG